MTELYPDVVVYLKASDPQSMWGLILSLNTSAFLKEQPQANQRDPQPESWVASLLIAHRVRLGPRLSTVLLPNLLIYHSLPHCTFIWSLNPCSFHSVNLHLILLPSFLLVSVLPDLLGQPWSFLWCPFLLHRTLIMPFLVPICHCAL